MSAAASPPESSAPTKWLSYGSDTAAQTGATSGSDKTAQTPSLAHGSTSAPRFNRSAEHIDLEASPWSDLCVATCSEDRTGRLWRSDIEGKFHCVAILERDNEESDVSENEQGQPASQQETGHCAGLTSIAFSPGSNDSILTTSKDETVKVWNSSGKVKHTLGPHTPSLNKNLDHAAWRGGRPRCHSDIVLGARWASDKFVVSWAADGTTIPWQMESDGSWSRVAVIEHSSPANKVDVGRQGQLLISGHQGNWHEQHLRKGMFAFDKDTSSGSAHRTTHTGPIFDICLRKHSAEQFLTASADSTAKLWDVEQSRLISSFDGHEDAVFNAQFVDRHTLLTCSADCTAKLWDDRSPAREVMTLAQHTGAVWSACVSSGGQSLVVTASHDMTARVWDLRSTDRTKLTLKGHTGILWKALFSPDSKCVITCSEDRTARIWDLWSGSETPSGMFLADAEQGGHCGAVTDVDVTLAPVSKSHSQRTPSSRK